MRVIALFARFKSLLVMAGTTALLLVVCAAIAAAVELNDEPQESAPVELISNGGFESAAGTWPDGFGQWIAQGQPELAIDEDIVHTGRRSIRIKGDGQSRASLNRSVSVEGGRAYTLSVWHRADRTQLPSSTIMRVMAFKTDGHAEEDKVPWRMDWVHDPSESGYALSGNNFHVSPLEWERDGGWQPLTVTFTLPDDVIRLDIQLFNWLGHGTVWYDDLSLVMLSPEATKPVKAEAKGDEIDIQELLKKEHPRLLATEADFLRIRELMATDRQVFQWYAVVKTRAEGILRESVSTYEIPDGLRLLETSRRVLDRIEALAMTYRLDGDTRYAERAWAEVEAAGNFPDWNPRHFLDTAEMTRAFAIAYDWLYDVWTDEQRAFLREAIISKGLEPALASYRGTAPNEWGWWVRSNHNWNFVVNGGIAMGALAIADEAPEIAEEVLNGGLASLQHAIGRFAPDGGWDEGVGYWHYSVRYLIPYLAALETALGTDFGLAETPGIAESGTFPIYLTGPTNFNFNFADSGKGAVRAPELLWLAHRFDRPEYVWWHRRMAAGSGGVGDLLWHRETPGAQAFDPSELALDRHFRAVEVAAFRSDWEDSDALFVAFKAGDNRANHSNLDLGTFVLDALGVRWAEELGADDYNLPGYFGGERWNYYRNRPEGQNTLVINPGAAPSQNPTANARIVHHVSKPEEALAIADLTPAYVGRASSVRRGIALFDERRQVLVQDEVTADEPMELWWFMHTMANIELLGDGASAVLRQGNKRLMAHILSPAGASFTVMPAKPLPTSPNPAGQNPNNGIQKLAVHLEDVTDVRLAVQFVPLEGNRFALLSPRVLPLDEWERAGSDEVLWPATPRMTLEIPALSKGQSVQGDLAIDLEVDGAEGIAVESVQIRFDGELIYSAGGFPEGLAVDTLALEDGTYTLEVQIAFVGGGRATHEMQVRVDNWWQLDDPFDPPIVSGFFGTIDRTKTSETSPGWTYATGRPDEFFGDDSRRAVTTESTEYLVWEAPRLQSVELVVYAPVQDLDETLIVEASPDGTSWHELATQVEARPHPSLERFQLHVRGRVPQDLDARWLRVTLQPGGIDVRQVELGKATLVGLNE